MIQLVTDPELRSDIFTANSDWTYSAANDDYRIADVATGGGNLVMVSVNKGHLYTIKATLDVGGGTINVWMLLKAAGSLIGSYKLDNGSGKAEGVGVADSDGNAFIRINPAQGGSGDTHVYVTHAEVIDHGLQPLSATGESIGLMGV